MEKRICRKCGIASYSADTKGEWECSNPMCRQIVKPSDKVGIEECREVHRVFEEEQEDFAY
jgi:hypothetical protein